MSAANRTSDVLSRALPFIVVAAIVIGAYFGLIQPRVSEYLRGRTELTSLDGRVRTLQDALARGRSAPLPDEATALKLFDERMSVDDHVSDVSERLARLVLDSAGKDMLKSLQIATGAPAQWSPGQAVATTRTADERPDLPDPRFGLFLATVTYTPVLVSFSSTYEAIQQFAWRLRDFPTMIEIRSVDLTRGLPLMRASFRIFVFQRGPAATAPSGPAAPANPPASPLAPRVARLETSEGW